MAPLEPLVSLCLGTSLLGCAMSRASLHRHKDVAAVRPHHTHAHVHSPVPSCRCAGTVTVLRCASGGAESDPAE
ncbi:MAG: hypothetical protein EOO65_04530 [Methanosarcinales archaeon]|nr:MAG: hypothetical protein EOO65_04530 [Methanosarcinales archaeon]